MKITIFIIILLSFNVQALELSEEKSIELYMNRNLAILGQKYSIDRAKAAELTASLWKNPSLFIDSQLNSFGKSWNQENAGGPAQQDVILTVPVDINGKRRQAVKVARLATKVVEAEFLAAIREGLYGMLDLIYSIQRLKQEQELLEEKVQLLDRLIITLQKRTGGPGNQPLLQSRAKLALEEAKVDLQNNKIEQSTQTNQLKIILDLDVQQDIETSVKLKSENTQAFYLDELFTHAKKHRPDFQALEVSKKQMNEQVELEHRRVWDDVGFQAGISNQDKVNARPGDSTSHNLSSASSWLLGVVIPIPVFDRNQGNILDAKLRTNQILVREKFMQEALQKDLATSIKKIELTSQNLHRYKVANLQSAKTVRDSAIRIFGTGGMSLIEYLDAVDAYHSTINKYIESQYVLTTEYLRLKLISGQEIVL